MAGIMSIPGMASVHAGIRTAGNDVWEDFNKYTASNSPLALPGAVPALTADSVAAAVKAVQALPPTALSAAEYNGVMNAYYDYGLNPTKENAQTVINLAEQSLDKVFVGFETEVETKNPDIDSGDVMGDNTTNNSIKLELGSNLKTNGFELIETKTAEVTNEEWAARGYDQPPARPGTKSYIVKAGDNQYVRLFSVYENGESNMIGRWIIRKIDIEGLTRDEIVNKYSLPEVPDYICDVILPPDYYLEVSEANGLPQWGDGGGIQFNTMDAGLEASWFINPRKLE